MASSSPATADGRRYPGVSSVSLRHSPRRRDVLLRVAERGWFAPARAPRSVPAPARAARPPARRSPPPRTRRHRRPPRRRPRRLVPTGAARLPPPRRVRSRRGRERGGRARHRGRGDAPGGARRLAARDAPRDPRDVAPPVHVQERFRREELPGARRRHRPGRGGLAAIFGREAGARMAQGMGGGSHRERELDFRSLLLLSSARSPRSRRSPSNRRSAWSARTRAWTRSCSSATGTTCA